MNSNTEAVRQNFNRITSKRTVGKTKGRVWNERYRRNRSI